MIEVFWSVVQYNCAKKDNLSIIFSGDLTLSLYLSLFMDLTIRNLEG